MDLWQLRSQIATSASVSTPWITVRLLPEVPTTTEYDRCAPNVFAASASLFSNAPSWSSRDPMLPRSMPVSVRKRFSP